MPSPYRISLVVIARDEAPRIGRLLHSVLPWVDEALVLDTGSRDDTVRIARDLGAKVDTLVWPDDFSAARNAALDRAGAHWHLVLDADEWLIEGGAFLRELGSMAPDFVGAVHLQDQFGEGGTQQAHHWLTRLLPGNIRYAGRIHEQPVHQLRACKTPLVVGHDGYQPAALAAKAGRNRRLLQADLDEHPNDAYLLYQLGKDAAIYRDYALAETSFARALQHAPREAPWRMDLIARRFNALKNLARHSEALGIAEAEAPTCERSPDIQFALGDVLLDWAAREPSRIRELLPRAEAAWLRCLEIGERPDIPGAVAGRGSRLAAHNLALIYEGTGRGSDARNLRERYGLDPASLLSS